MMRPSFKRAFKTIIKRRPDLKSKIEETLRLLATEPYNPLLKTHKLKGKLSGAWSCSLIINYFLSVHFPISNLYSPVLRNIILKLLGFNSAIG